MNSVNMILEGNGMISSRRRCAVRKGVLTNFAKFTGKHLCQSMTLVLSWEFWKIPKNNFFTEHLWTTASMIRRNQAGTLVSQAVSRSSILGLLSPLNFKGPPLNLA